MFKPSRTCPVVDQAEISHPNSLQTPSNAVSPASENPEQSLFSSLRTIRNAGQPIQRDNEAIEDIAPEDTLNRGERTRKSVSACSSTWRSSTN